MRLGLPHPIRSLPSRSRAMGRYGIVICLGMALPCTTLGSEPLRFGVHPEFDRVVVTLPADAPYTATQDAGRVVIAADALGVVVASEPGGRRIGEISGGRNMLSFSAAPSARRRIWRLGDRLVIDVFAVQAPNGRAVAAAPGIIPAHGTAGTAPRPGATAPLPQTRARVPVAAAASAAAAIHPAASPVAAPVAAPAAATVAATVASGTTHEDRPLQVAAPGAGPGAGPPGSPQGVASLQLQAADETFPLGSFVVLAPQDTGAAAFARNGVAHVVFDTVLPLDLAALTDDPAYGATVADPLATASHLLLKLPGGMRLLLLLQKEGWRLGFSRLDQKQNPIAISARAGGLVFDAPSSGSTVVIDDRQTGATLLVGTQRSGMAHVPAARRTPEFVLPATWLGVVVETISDRLVLRAGVDGFTLRSDTGPILATSWPGSAEAAASEAAGLTRRFDLPDLPVPMLRVRLHDAMRDEVRSPTLARHDARLKTAQAMLALGLDVEALALLDLAASDDPASDAQDGPALRAIAAGLANRQDTPGAQASPSPSAARAGTTDEDAFWQAALRPSGADIGPAADTGQAAATLAATWKLAQSYPETLRRVLLPRVADMLLRGGQLDAAEALLRASPQENLDLARAELARLRGHPDQALAGFERVAAGPDRDQRAQARLEAVELRLADHRLSAGDAAKALQSQVFAWRGDERELDLRLRVASLLEQSGAWRAALGALRDAEHLYPEAHDRLHEAQTALVRDLLKQDAASAMPPLELVALVGECADLLGQSPAGAVLAPVLVDKLLALDLPERAEPILRRMIQNASSPAPKAELGLRLAELLLAKGDASGASAALDTTAAPDLAAGLASSRNLFKARLLASIGDKEGALRLLATSDLPEALDQRAALMEQLHDWQGAEAVLATAIGQRVGGTGTLSGARADLVLRYASDAAQARDMAALRKIRADEGARLSGTQADLLRVLTQAPIQAVDDLPRAGQELAVARALPASFAGLSGR